jgi:hypothetical protein
MEFIYWQSSISAANMIALRAFKIAFESAFAMLSEGTLQLETIQNPLKQHLYWHSLQNCVCKFWQFE